MTNWSADPCLPHDARSHKSSGIQKKPAGQGSNPCAPTFSRQTNDAPVQRLAEAVPALLSLIL